MRAGKAAVSAIGRTRAAVKVGRVGEIARGLDAIAQRIADADTAARGLANGWAFDAGAYLSDGRFLDDLKSAAAEAGLALFEEGGRIFLLPFMPGGGPRGDA